jgi:uncharacterized membrane protein
MKDVIATILAVLVAFVLYAKLKGMSLPMLGSYRTAAIVLLILGIALCAVGSKLAPGQSPWSNPVTMIVAILGIVSLVAGISAIAANSRMAFIGFAGITLLMWLITTARHVFAK